MHYTVVKSIATHVGGGICPRIRADEECATIFPRERASKVANLRAPSCVLYSHTLLFDAATSKYAACRAASTETLLTNKLCDYSVSELFRHSMKASTNTSESATSFCALVEKMLWDE